MGGNPINTIDPLGLDGVGFWTYPAGPMRDQYYAAQSGPSFGSVVLDVFARASDSLSRVNDSDNSNIFQGGGAAVIGVVGCAASVVCGIGGAAVIVSGVVFVTVAGVIGNHWAETKADDDFSDLNYGTAAPGTKVTDLSPVEAGPPAPLSPAQLANQAAAAAAAVRASHGEHWGGDGSTYANGGAYSGDTTTMDAVCAAGFCGGGPDDTTIRSL